MSSASAQATVTFIGYPIAFPVRQASLRFEHSKHSLAFVTCQFTDQQATIVPEGTPAVLTWGKAPGGMANFYGYVNHYELSKPTTKSRQQITYVLIGTSRDLNNENTQSWRKISDSYVVRQIAKTHRFRSIVHATKDIWPYLSQSGSDFAYINQLAEQDGYRPFIHNCVLYYLDPFALLLVSTSAVMPIFYADGAGGDTIKSFEMIQGTTVPRGGVQATRTTYGLSSNGRLIQSVSASSSAIINKLVLPRPVGSYAEAANLSQAVQNKNAGWITATVKVLGDVRLLPNQVVTLSGKALDPNAQGLWLVDAADHEIIPEVPGISQNSMFQTTVKLSKNAQAGNAFGNVMPLTASGSLQDPFLSNGIWQAPVLQEVIYA